MSGLVSEVVPAKVDRLRIYPRKVAWGRTIHIVGQLKGGYLPSAARSSGCKSASARRSSPTECTST